MANHGLHCINCSFNFFDSIENGAKIHGMSDEDVTSLINELNTINEKNFDYPFYITLKALDELKASKTLEEYVEIYADDELHLNIRLSNEKKKNQVEVDYKNVKIIFDKEIEKLVKNIVVDYVTDFNFEGFTIGKLF
ncbi:Uncharacterised protein [uncultured archaeon]|nr:Uncharacterised protein [uncultured archaeon]